MVHLSIHANSNEVEECIIDIIHVVHVNTCNSNEVKECNLLR